MALRIVYGVSGEGSGHASRAAEVLAHLVERGHVVKVASYDRGFRALSLRFDVLEVEGLSIGTSDNHVSLIKTFTENLAKLPDGVRSLRLVKRALFEEFKPDVVLCDFEPLTAHLARHFELPLVTIDNQHLLRYVDFPRPTGLAREALVSTNLVRALVPKPDVSLVTSFYRGRVLNRRTFLFPPILRREVLELRPTRGEHVLVYFTKGFDSALETLRASRDERFVVYGYEREETVGNIEFKRASSAGFLRDLATCKAVIATAGLTLLTEALHLGKPMLALPMAKQFEQELNAALLTASGFGAGAREIEAATLADFLQRVPEFELRLRDYPRADNTLLFAKLDALLADGAVLARDFHARRDELGNAPE